MAAKEYISFLIDPKDKVTMERIAQQNALIGEEVNVSVIYREAVRQFIVSYQPVAARYPEPEPVE